MRHGASVEFTDYRDYAAGDDLRTIDWKAYGRLDKLLVKLFREEDDLSLHLLLDASVSMMFGERPDKLLFAKRLCAALGAVALLDFDRCAISVASGETTHAIRRGHALRGRSSLPTLLAAINRVEPVGNARLSAALAELLQGRTSPGVLVVVSDFYDHGITPALLARAGRSLDVALVHVAAPEEIDPIRLIEADTQAESAGEVRLLDSESGAAVELTLTAEAVERYRIEYQRFCDELSAISRAGGATYMRVPTDTPLDEVVLGALRKQGVVSARA